MPKLPDLSNTAVLKRQALTEAMRAEREAAPPPPPTRKRIRLATRMTGSPSRSKKVH